MYCKMLSLHINNLKELKHCETRTSAIYFLIHIDCREKRNIKYKFSNNIFSRQLEQMLRKELTVSRKYSQENNFKKLLQRVIFTGVLVNISVSTLEPFHATSHFLLIFSEQLILKNQFGLTKNIVKNLEKMFKVRGH